MQCLTNTFAKQKHVLDSCTCSSDKYFKKMGDAYFLLSFRNQRFDSYSNKNKLALSTSVPYGQQFDFFIFYFIFYRKLTKEDINLFYHYIQNRDLSVHNKGFILLGEKISSKMPFWLLRSFFFRFEEIFSPRD